MSSSSSVYSGTFRAVICTTKLASGAQRKGLVELTILPVVNKRTKPRSGLHKTHVARFSFSFDTERQPHLCRGRSNPQRTQFRPRPHVPGQNSIAEAAKKGRARHLDSVPSRHRGTTQTHFLASLLGWMDVPCVHKGERIRDIPHGIDWLRGFQMCQELGVHASSYGMRILQCRRCLL